MVRKPLCTALIISVTWLGFLQDHSLDLVVEEVDVYPEEPIEGFTEYITIEVVIQNIGDEDVSNVDVYLWINDTLGGTVYFNSSRIQSFTRSSVRKINFIVYDIPPGDACYDIIVSLDPKNNVSESNEVNNVATRKITVYHIDEEAKGRYEDLDEWLNEKLVEWKPSSYRPMHFIGFHCPLSNGYWNYTTLEDDLLFLDMLEESGVDIISIGIYGAPEDLPKSILDRYDVVIKEVRSRGLELKIWLRTFMYDQRERTRKALNATLYVMERWNPDYLAILHEPKCDTPLAMQYLKEWVEDCCELAKKINPNVTTSVTLLNYYGRLDCLDYLLQIDELDIIGFDIYGLWGLCKECEGGDAIAETIDRIHAAGKDTWIEEFWLSIEWDRRTSDPIDMVPGFNDPHRARWDSRFIRVITYYAQNHGLLAIEPWFTPYFILYPGYATIWELHGGSLTLKDDYVRDFRQALVEGRRTLVFYSFKNIIEEVSNGSGVDAEIVRPRNGLYVFDREFLRVSPWILVIGGVTVDVKTFGNISMVEFYVDDKLKSIDYEYPYQWFWDEPVIGRYEIKVVAYNGNRYKVEDKINIIIFNL